MGTAKFDLLSNFKVNTTYRFILYISTIIWVFSLFIPVNGYNLNALQFKTLFVSLCGLLIWFASQIIEDMATIYLSKTSSADKAQYYYNWIKILQGMYLVLTIIIVLD